MSNHLIEAFRHSHWSTLRILDWCDGLDDELLDSSAPGTFGDARTTLVHLVGAEERYVELLTGEPILETERLNLDDPFPGIDVLRQRADTGGLRLIELAGETPFDAVVEGEFLDGNAYRLRATTLLIQALHHAAEHRTHVMTVISQHGIEVPDTDGWTYGDENLPAG